MKLIEKKQIQPGVFWISIPKIDFRLLCSCPADVIKHLKQQDLLPLITKKGRTFESGPNAILLSDTFTQNGTISNLSEFPLLHMLYRQGMILPDHPNNTGEKPILVGKTEQLEAQKGYFYKGNFGLVNPSVYTELGETPEFAAENISYKLNFAFGQFLETDELVHCIPLEEKAVELCGGLLIERKGFNLFSIRYQGDEVEVDLNLNKDQSYLASYQLPKIEIPKARFGVMHTGEGDGWDPNRPCLGSMVINENKYYLVDAGPQIRTTLEALSLTPQDLSGIFFTHVHDDHFAGLYSIMSDDYKLKIFATRVVYKTVIQKLAALTSIKEAELEKKFEFIPLKLDEWNKIAEMEVKPLISPHPVDTTVLLFRAQALGQYKTYGHLSDITALKALRKMIVNNVKDQGILQKYYDSMEQVYTSALDVKKADVGGAPIHGEANDFKDDPSKKLVLAHTSQPLNEKQLAIGHQAQFGETDILIPQDPT